MSCACKQSIKAKVTGNRALCGGWALVEFEAPGIAAEASPGQFLEVRAWYGSEPLLRRPLSIAGVNGGKVSLLLKAVGEGTRRIAAVAPGSEIDVAGPLGNGFPKPGQNDFVWLVGGGTGVAPLLYMMDVWKGQELKLFYGARSSADCGAMVLLPDEAVVATENGDAGIEGLVTEALALELSDCDRAPDAIYTCGPVAMMKHVHKLAAEAGVKCFASLETMMGCGFGACLGCAVKGAGERYLHVCKDGPVFDSTGLAW